MSTTVQRSGQSLVSDLMSWMGSGTTPDVRIEEYVEGDRRVVRADLPGIDPDRDVELVVEGNTLRLHGERRAEQHDLHRTEIRYGSFERILMLPAGTTPQDVTAEYADGVLTVTMPTKATTGTARIPVTHRELPAE